MLSSHEDPSFLRTVLNSHIAREYLPAPKVNLVRGGINGESWGVYANAEQFNKDFTKEFFGSTKGARWKVSGSPKGRGSFAYPGDKPECYKTIYNLKTKDDPKVWADLIRLTKVLHETPPDQLEAALRPRLDIEGALKFLAVENALINNDGYWIRTSDYALYQDEGGKFHVVPHDMNEGLTRPGGLVLGAAGPGVSARAVLVVRAPLPMALAVLPVQATPTFRVTATGLKDPAGPGAVNAWKGLSPVRFMLPKILPRHLSQNCSLYPRAANDT